MTTTTKPTNITEAWAWFRRSVLHSEDATTVEATRFGFYAGAEAVRVMFIRALADAKDGKVDATALAARIEAWGVEVDVYADSILEKAATR